MVEVAGRFIGQEHDRVLDQGPGDRHSLLLAALTVWTACGQPVAEPDLGEDVLGLGLQFGVTPSGMNGNNTLPTAVRLWIRLNCWKTKPIFWRRKASCWTCSSR